MTVGVAFIITLNFWYAEHRPGGPREERSVSIPKYFKSIYLSSLESFEGPPICSDKSLTSGALLDPIYGPCDPEETEGERGTEPE
jgi:hypothetical protein